MAISNGFGSFWVGNSGLASASNGIYVAGNNLTNVSTTGYVRQRMLQSDSTYNRLTTVANAMTGLQTRVGLGVTSAEILHTRDVFLDKYYRQENGRVEFYSTMHETTDEVETIMQELEGEAFQTSLTDFWESFAELAKDPSDSVYQELVAQKGSLFISKAQSLIQSLREYQDNLNSQVEDMVDTINGITSSIAELNVKIMSIEGQGQETAYTLRDERDNLLDELSKYVKIDYEELNDTSVRVKIDGVVVVDEKKAFDMELYTDESTGYATPVWSHLSSDGNPYYVFDLSKGYSNEKNSDIGSLKALLFSRGEEASNYIDALGFTDSSPLVDSTGTIGTSSLLQDVEAMLDTLVHEIVTQINDIFSPITNVLYDGMEIGGVTYYSGDTLEVDGTTYTVGDGTIAFTDSSMSLNPGDTVLIGSALEEYTVSINSDGQLVFTSSSGDELTYSVGDTVTYNLETASGNIVEYTSVLEEAELDTLPFYIWDEAKGYLGSDDSAPGAELFSRLYVDRYTTTSATVSDTSSGTSSSVSIYVYNAEDNEDTYNYVYKSGSIYAYDSTQKCYVNVDDSTDTYTPVSGDGHVFCDANGNVRDTTTLYSIMNLQINPDVQENATKLPYHDAEGDVAMDMGEALDELWSLDLTALGGQDFMEYYTELIQDIGIWGTTFDSFEETLDSTVASIDSSRQSVMSVSSDEELTALIRYQNAYNAASRYINVIDSMTELIVSLI